MGMKQGMRMATAKRASMPVRFPAWICSGNAQMAVMVMMLGIR